MFQIIKNAALKLVTPLFHCYQDDLLGFDLAEDRCIQNEGHRRFEMEYIYTVNMTIILKWGSGIEEWIRLIRETEDFKNSK